jgi:hypothetical protein
LQPSASKSINTKYRLNAETQMAQLKNPSEKGRKIDRANPNPGDFYTQTDYTTSAQFLQQCLRLFQV